MSDQLFPTSWAGLMASSEDEGREIWDGFYLPYRKLIYNAACRAGLGEAEAEEVTVEACRTMSAELMAAGVDFRKRGLKARLHDATLYHIRKLRFRKRGGRPKLDMAATGALEEISLSDPGEAAFDQNWDADWEASLPEAAMELVKRTCDLKEFQIYDLAVVKGWSTVRIAMQLGMSPISVWLATNRIRRQVKAELDRLTAIR